MLPVEMRLPFTYLATALKVSRIPADLKWSHIFGVGLLGGIGFTMSIFITLLAFDEPFLIDSSKLSVMLASLTAGIIGFLWLKRTLGRSPAVI